MIGVPKIAGGERFVARVVFGVGRGQHNRARPGHAERGVGEGIEAGRINMLDHFDHGRGVVSGEP